MINISDINTSSMEVPDAQSPMAAKEQDALAHEAEQFKNELGWLGKPFGVKKEKPGNISGLVIVACFILLAAFYFLPSKTNHAMSYE